MKKSEKPPIPPRNVSLDVRQGELLPPEKPEDVLLAEPRRKYGLHGDKYLPEFAEQAAKLCALGAIDPELADFFSVTTATINNWKVAHADFNAAVKAGKSEADDRVERALYARAVGYTFDAVRIFVSKDGQPTAVPYREHVAPDVTACIFWLKNRRPDQWKDVHQHKLSGSVVVLSEEEMKL